MSDQARAADSFGVTASTHTGETGRERGYLIVRKWDGDQVAYASAKLGGDAPGTRGFINPTPRDFARLGLTPEITQASASNLITTAGWQRIFEKATGNAAQAFDATHTRIGVGTATAVAAVGQTDLQAAAGTANRLFNLAGTAWATAAGTGTLRWTCAASFASGEANFAWQEWALDAGTASGSTVTAPMMNRAVASLGTKASPAVWTATVQLDLT